MAVTNKRTLREALDSLIESINEDRAETLSVQQSGGLMNLYETSGNGEDTGMEADACENGSEHGHERFLFQGNLEECLAFTRGISAASRVKRENEERMKLCSAI